MDFILGCNYWASHAGAEMWQKWDQNVVEKDLEILSKNGIAYMRVFPNWKDFQPVKPLYTGMGELYEYLFEGDLHPSNKYYLDENMLNHFETFCEIAQKHNIRLIVGLITGWMSGRLFIPTALNGKNLYTDSTALMFQQKFIRGFVERFKGHEAIYAWDLGNECNVMSEAKMREEAYSWSATISNAIRAVDSTRPVISGMHSLTIDQQWTIADQAEVTDILTTHPYPYWVPHCTKDKMLSIRTLLHATAETTLYSSIGGKPCLVEELGTMGPMVCNDARAADFMRVNLFSNWANGSVGVMWWCANEQTNLSSAPYNWVMCERELGMLDVNQKPKPMLLEMKNFSNWIGDLNFKLPKQTIDAVCILTKGQTHWGVAYTTYILAKQAGASITFADGEQELPDAAIYLLPSITGHLVMKKERYEQLKRKVSEGASIYISMGNGFLTEFEAFTGVSIVDSEEANDIGMTVINEKEIEYRRKKRFTLCNKKADVLAVDQQGSPLYTKHRYGKGLVYYLNFPLEEMLINQNEGFSKNNHEFLKSVFKDNGLQKIVSCENPFIGVTEHFDGQKLYVVLINYSDQELDCPMQIHKSYKLVQIHYGNLDKIQACDATVLELEQDIL